MPETTTSVAGQGTPDPFAAPPTSEAQQKLNSARTRIGIANMVVAASEGRVLEYETADSLERTLGAVLRDLEAVEASLEGGVR